MIENDRIDLILMLSKPLVATKQAYKVFDSDLDFDRIKATPQKNICGKKLEYLKNRNADKLNP
jgi:protein associated with RNAse G/E